MYVVEENQESFEFEVEGQTYAIPVLSELPIQLFRKVQAVVRAADGSAEEAAVYAMLDAFEELAPGCTEKLSYMQAMKLMRAYVAGNGGQLGESSTSSS